MGTTADANIFGIRSAADDKNEFSITNPANLRASINGTSTGATGINVSSGWHHVAVVVRSTGSTANTILWYIDGDLSVTQNISQAFSSSASGLLKIGTTSTLEMHLAELRFWKVERSITQIRNSMSVELLGHENSLISYWKVNEKIPLDGRIEYLQNSANPSYWLANTSTTSNSKLSVSRTAGLFAFFDSSFSSLPFHKHHRDFRSIA